MMLPISYLLLLWWLGLLLLCGGSGGLSDVLLHKTQHKWTSLQSITLLESPGRQETILLTMNWTTTGHGLVAMRKPTVFRVLNAYVSSAPWVEEKLCTCGERGRRTACSWDLSSCFLSFSIESKARRHSCKHQDTQHTEAQSPREAGRRHIASPTHILQSIHA
jgi:hypothetical protein